MPVIGVNQVSPNVPRPTFWGDMGYAQGAQTSKLIDKLLSALLLQQSGGGGPFAPKNIPNPTYQAPGAFPTLNSDISMSYDPGAFAKAPMASPQVPSQILSQISTPKPQGPYSNQPLVNADTFKRIQDLQTYQKNAQDIASAPYDTRLKELKAQQAEQAVKYGLIPVIQADGTIAYQQFGGTGFPGVDTTGFNETQVEDDALAGDEDAIAAYRYLRRKRGVQ